MKKARPFEILAGFVFLLALGLRMAGNRESAIEALVLATFLIVWDLNSFLHAEPEGK